MKYSISPDRTRLTITVDDAERAELRNTEAIEYDDTMTDFFERLTANSELDWINPAETGDLTDAPMLGIRDYDGQAAFPVLERWAWMDYQVQSLLVQLRDHGNAVLVGGA